MTRDERLQRCERLIARALDQNDALSTRIAELEVQARFIMGCLKIKKPGTVAGLIDGTGKPVIDIVDGWQTYTQFGGRDHTLKVLEAEFIALRLDTAVQEKIANGDTRDAEIIRQECAAIFEDARRAAEAADTGDSGSRLESEHADVTPGVAH